MNTYDIGDSVKITTSTVFQDAAGATFDPDVVRFRVRPPGAAAVTYVYGTDSEASRLGEGDYKLEIDVDVAGQWAYRIEGEQNSGANRGAAEGAFLVRESEF